MQPDATRCDLCYDPITDENAGQVTESAVLCADCLKRLVRHRERQAPKDDLAARTTLFVGGTGPLVHVEFEPGPNYRPRPMIHGTHDLGGEG